MESTSETFEVTICVSPESGDIEERLRDFEVALRRHLARIEAACGSAVVALTWSEVQHAYRRFEVRFSQPCNGAAITFAVDAAAVASGAAVPDGHIVLTPSGECLRVSPQVDRPCDAVPQDA